MQIEHMFKIKVKAREIINDTDLVEDDNYAKQINICNDFIE